MSEFAVKQNDKKTYLQTLNKLLTGGESPEEIKEIKEGFKDHLDEVKNRHRELEIKVDEVKRNLAATKASGFSWDKIGDQAERVLKIMAEHDPEALKQAYHTLFKRVVVGPENENGIRTVEYVLSEPTEDGFGPRSEMVEKAFGGTGNCSPVHSRSPDQNSSDISGFCSQWRTIDYILSKHVAKTKEKAFSQNKNEVIESS